MPNDRPAIVTSMKVDEALWKEAKKKAIDEGITLQTLLNEAVEARIEDAAKVKALAAKYRGDKKDE